MSTRSKPQNRLPDPTLVREWAAAYRSWNELKTAHRREAAKRESFEGKMAIFLDLCEAVGQISSPKGPALLLTQRQTHALVQERLLLLERRRSRGKPPACRLSSPYPVMKKWSWTVRNQGHWPA